MPYPKNTIPTVYLTVGIPEDIHTKMTLHLWSRFEKRVPVGSHKAFLSGLIREFFDFKRLDLAPFANVEPGIYVVSGSPATLELLKRTLKGEIK